MTYQTRRTGSAGEPLKFGEPTAICYQSVEEPDFASVYYFVKHTLPILLNAPPPVKPRRNKKAK
jgi:hypothetical protein